MFKYGFRYLASFSALLAFSISGQAAITPVAPGVKTLSAAVAAASASDTLVLSTGTYDEGVLNFALPITIVAGSGQEPLVHITLANITAPDNGGWLFDVKSTAGLLTWDGIDILFDAIDLTQSAKFRALIVENGTGPNPASNIAILKNCSIKDSVAGTSPATGNAFGLLAKAGSRLQLDNVVVDLSHSTLNDAIVSYRNGTIPAEVVLNDCDITVGRISGGGAMFNLNSTFIMNRTTLTAVAPGVDWLFEGQLDSDFVIDDCVINFNNNVFGRGLMMRLSDNTGTCAANRTLFTAEDAGTSATGCRDFSMEGPGATIDLTNCAILYKGSQSFGSPWVNENGGNLLLKHTTITDVSPAAGSTPVRMSNGSVAATPGQVTVQNCLLNVAGEVPTAYISTVGNSDSQITWTIGTNFVSGTAANVSAPADDKLGTGTVVEGNDAVTLQADGYHLTVGGTNPAVDTAPNIGITDDIDNQVRPHNSGFDFGADESIQPTRAQSWSLY